MIVEANPHTEVEISYEPGPSALRFHRSPARVKVAWGPVRTGKSVAGCWRIFDKACEAAKDRVALKAVILRDTYRNLSDTTMKSWMEWFGQCGTLKNQQGVSDFLLRTPNSELVHQVLFRHGQTAQDASSFLSSDYGVIFLEEAAPAFTPSGLVSPGIAEEVFDLSLTRLIQKGIPDPELIITCNPPTPQHWVNKRIIALPIEELRAKNWWHFFFPASENEKNLRPGYYDELRAALKGKDHILRRFVEGEIVAIYPGMPVFQHDFNQNIHVRDNLVPIPDHEILFGFDAGESLTPAAIWFQIDAKGRVLVLHELQAGYTDERLREGIGTREFAQQIKQITATKFPKQHPGLVYADPAIEHGQPGDTVQTVRQILEAEGFILELGEIDIPSRVESIRGRLTSNIGGEPSILVSRSGCPILIEALSGAYRYRTTQDATRLVGATPVKDMYSNPVDALGYPMSKLFPAGMFSELLVNQLNKSGRPEIKKSWSVFGGRRRQ